MTGAHRRRRSVILSLLIVPVLAMTGCATLQPAGVAGEPTRSTSTTTPSPPRHTPATTPAPPSHTASPTPSHTTSPTPTHTTSPTPTHRSHPSLAQLPRGGRTVFPRYRLAGWVGTPGAPALGRLGEGSLSAQANAMVRQVAAYAGGRQVLPVMELIAVVAQHAPGADGKYRYRQPDRVVDAWLRVARAHKALLLLNIQPGRSDFGTEVRAYAKYLRLPDVGVALDPEWAMAPGQVPGRLFGHTTGAELNAVSTYLSHVVARHRLPQKVLVYHQVARSVVSDLAALKPHPGVVVIRSVDGIGTPAQKTDTWKEINRDHNPAVHPGFKLFFHEDRDRSNGVLMTPKQVLALRPRPDYVMYE